MPLQPTRPCKYSSLFSLSRIHCVFGARELQTWRHEVFLCRCFFIALLIALRRARRRDRGTGCGAFAGSGAPRAPRASSALVSAQSLVPASLEERELLISAVCLERITIKKKKKRRPDKKLQGSDS